MSRESILIIFGALVFISPWSGLPPSWMEVVLPLLALGIIAIAVTLRRRTPQVSVVARTAEHTESADAHPTRPFIS